MNKHLPVLIALLGFGLVGCATKIISSEYSTYSNYLPSNNSTSFCIMDWRGGVFTGDCSTSINGTRVPNGKGTFSYQDLTIDGNFFENHVTGPLSFYKSKIPLPDMILSGESDLGIINNEQLLYLQFRETIRRLDFESNGGKTNCLVVNNLIQKIDKAICKFDDIGGELVLVLNKSSNKFEVTKNTLSSKYNLGDFLSDLTSVYLIKEGVDNISQASKSSDEYVVKKKCRTRLGTNNEIKQVC